jgi:hypothetical protein
MITRQTSSNSKLINQEKLEEREAWHKIVVKILSWKNGLAEGGSIQITDKITSQEWDTYYQSTIKINTVNGKDKAIAKLKEIKESITKHNGFA